MILRDILQVKGSSVHTIVPTATLEEVVDRLVQCNCGSLVVCEIVESGDRRVVGIVTERDILRSCAARRAPLNQLTVAEVMSKRLITGRLHDTVECTMGLMTENRVRHLPVMDDERLCGIISIGDVVKAQHEQMVMENHYLKSYIQS